MDNKKYRIFILGAGFSKPAGLPLGDELWKEIIKISRSFNDGMRASKLKDDINNYIKFKSECDNKRIAYEDINFEEFLGYLDIEHYLDMRGSDTWSEYGNEGQVVVKTLIGQILAGKIPPKDKIPDLYLEFARRLQPHDIIINFNNDVLLERALDKVGNPYRLFLDRYISVDEFGGIIDDNKEEILILKIHGSIDWFDKPDNNNSHFHPVFNNNIDLGLTKVVDGPRHADDPLINVYRVDNIEHLYRQDIMFTATPKILNPSTNKVIYANTIHNFFRGINSAGGLNFGMAIIGYSLPDHDIYAKQAIYSMVKNYQNYRWNEDFSGMRKSPLVIVDYKNNEKALQKFTDNYRFVDFNKANLYMDGFTSDSLDKIFI